MKRLTFRVMAGTAGAVAVVVAVLAIGVVPINASSGHWPITAWFLSSVMKRSVAFHSRSVEVPNFEPGLEVVGAGYYEHGCRRCHGKPAGPVPVALLAATPHPPALGNVASDYTAAELFTVIEHGVKFTGMPAWPRLSRGEEAWSVVAMLQQVNGAQEATYDRLLDAGPPVAEAPAFLHRQCSSCHGQRGEGRGPASMPVLAGQQPEYLRASLQAFANRQRFSGIMEPIAASMTEAEMAQAAEFYAAQSGRVVSPKDVDATAYALGRELATQGDFARRIPACSDCHTRGDETNARVAAAPVLYGQSAAYVSAQLKLFAEKRRGGTHYARLMDKVRVDELTEAEREALAVYFANTAR